MALWKGTAVGANVDSQMLGHYLRELRRVADCSQSELAARLGVDESWINNYEKGRILLDRLQIDLVLGALEYPQKVLDNQLIDWYENGDSLETIGKRVGMYARSVSRRLRKHGVRIRPQRCGGRTDVPYGRLAELYAEGWTGKELGRVVNVAAGTVLNNLRRHGVTIRTPKEQASQPRKRAWNLGEIADYLNEPVTPKLQRYLRSVGLQPLVECKAPPMWDSEKACALLDADQQHRRRQSAHHDEKYGTSDELAAYVGLKDSRTFRRYLTVTLGLTPADTSPSVWVTSQARARLEEAEQNPDSAYRQVAEWLSRLENDRTRRTYDRVVLRWLDWLDVNGKTMTTAEPDDVRHWVNQRLKPLASPRTVQLHVSVLRTFYHFLNLSSNPADQFAKGAKANASAERRRRLPSNGAVSRKVSATGVVPLYGHSIIIGRRWAGTMATIFWQSNDVTVLIDNTVVRTLTVNPAERYQPLAT